MRQFLVRPSCHNNANLKKTSGHKEKSSRRLRLDELAVQDLKSCLSEFEANPFDSSNTVKKLHLKSYV